MIIYRGKAKTNSWAKWLTSQIKKNKNNLVSIIGKTGSGKTYSGISICEIMEKMDGVHFGIEHIVFSLRELMELINSGNLKKGSKIIFDEPQVSISAREFQSEANKVFNFLLSTFRHRNLTLFFCTPFESLLDKNTRKLFHVKMETLSINVNDKTCKLKPRYVEYADFKAEPYRKQLIVIHKNSEGINKVNKVFHWDVPLPSKEIIELYEKKKLDFTNLLNLNITDKLQKFDESGKSMTAKPRTKQQLRKPLTERQEKIMTALGKGTPYPEIAKAFGITRCSVSLHKTASFKKGYLVEEFKEKWKVKELEEKKGKERKRKKGRNIS